MTTALYTVFHLNLAFSSTEEHQHFDVITQCYWPLLQISQDGIPIGIEMTAYTLEAINAAAPEWVSEFRTLLSLGKCELIASGDRVTDLNRVEYHLAKQDDRLPTLRQSESVTAIMEAADLSLANDCSIVKIDRINNKYCCFS